MAEPDTWVRTHGYGGSQGGSGLLDKLETGGGKSELSNATTEDMFTAMLFFVYILVFLFYFLACSALSTLVYDIGPVRSRDSWYR